MEIDGMQGMLSTDLTSSLKNRPSKHDIEKMQEEQSEDISESMLEILDEDGDGNLSREELGISQEAFEALDIDTDGIASTEELASYIKTELGNKMEERRGEEPPPMDVDPEEMAGKGREEVLSILEDLGISEEDAESIMSFLEDSKMDIQV